MSDRIVKGMFVTTEEVIAFSTMPPRNIVKLVAIPCTIHPRLCSSLVRLPHARQALLMAEVHSRASMCSLTWRPSFCGQGHSICSKDLSQISHLNDEGGSCQARANGNYVHPVELVLVRKIPRSNHGHAIYEVVGIPLDQPILHGKD